MSIHAIQTRPPAYALRVLPDETRYRCRYEVASQSSNRVYRISFDMALQAWSCSCRGCISHGQCKHLTAAGLYGRKYGKNPEQHRQFTNGDTRRSIIPSLPEIEKIVGKEKKQKALPLSTNDRAAVCAALRIKDSVRNDIVANDLLEE